MFKNLVIYVYYKKINLIEKNEFIKLIKSSNMSIDKFIYIRIRKFNRKYFFGIGKLNEIFFIIKKKKYNQLLINVTLKSIQEYNLKKFLNCNLLNRINIILNIFKKRAIDSYSKLQVELAYLNYLSTRLVKKWTHLERQKGGTRYISGPGEKQIEIDRRIIKKKINFVLNKINKNILNKNQEKFLRNKNEIPLVSLVGYTNSGKSTLFNCLTNYNLESKDFFFTTLDTYIKKINKFNFFYNVLISDTIGFIRNLPSVIYDAFKSTLQEIKNSDLILHIVDISDIYFNDYINVVNLILSNININNIPVILVMNKIDKIYGLKEKIEFNINNEPIKIWISAKNELGIIFIKKVIDFYLFNKFIKYNLFIPVNLFNIFNNFKYKKRISSVKWNNFKKYYILDIFLTKNEIDFFLKKYPRIIINL